MDRKREQLGMPLGTAMARLKKLILFDLLKTAGLNICYQCQQPITKVEELSIDHKKPWLHESTKLFWDLSNIGYSHLSCNSGARRKDRTTTREERISRLAFTPRFDAPEGQTWCSGCTKYKPLEAFSLNANKPNGRQAECRACRSVKRRKT